MNRSSYTLPMHRFTHFCLVIGTVFLLVIGCSAPHDNPLDPDSKFYQPPAEAPTPPSLTVRVLSRHISRNFPSTDFYSILPQLRGVTPAEADSCWVRFKEEEPIPIGYDDVWDYWGATFPGSQFDNTQGEGAVGWPFRFEVRMKDGLTYTAGPAYLVRVVLETPVVIAPAHDSTVTAFPLLQWQPFEAAFPFGYLATVIDFSVADTIWLSPLLASETPSVVVTDSLPIGLYYWTITVVDSFGNISRSKEGDFAVDTTGTRGSNSSARALTF